MNSAAISLTRALVRANPRRLTASWSLAVGCCQQQPYLPMLPTRDFVVALYLCLSRSVLLWLLSYARVPFVLTPAEAGDIRSTAPPNKEMGWDGCAK